jgi:hypothetical protein
VKYGLLFVFLNARIVKPVDIHCEICDADGESTMSCGMVRNWVRKFNEVRDNVHDEQPFGRPGRLWSQATMFYEEGIQKLVPRYDKCHNNDGNYVEK